MLTRNLKLGDPPDDITFNAIVIVQSLDDKDMKTGSILRDYINALDIDEAPVHATLVDIRSRTDFLHLVVDLTNQAREVGLLPILHIEVHGNEDSGIWFADDSCLSWNDFCDAITPLNDATDLRLVVSVAACYGSSLITGVRLSKPAPCFALIGPTDTILEPELQGLFRDFYGAMLRTRDAGPAIRALKGHSLQKGAMHAITARHWFELLMSKYLAEEATPRKIKQFAMRQYLQARAAGQGTLSPGEYKRMFRRELPNVVRTYFENFFMIHDAPSNKRYGAMWARFSDRLARM